jgi:hypothetical protein
LQRASSAFQQLERPILTALYRQTEGVICLYQLAMFMDIIDFSWALEECKPYVQNNNFNDLDKDFCTMLGLTMLESQEEMRGKFEQESQTTKRVFCFTCHLESGIAAVAFPHYSGFVCRKRTWGHCSSIGPCLQRVLPTRLCSRHGGRSATPTLSEI